MRLMACEDVSCHPAGGSEWPHRSGQRAFLVLGFPAASCSRPSVAERHLLEDEGGLRVHAFQGSPKSVPKMCPGLADSPVTVVLETAGEHIRKPSIQIWWASRPEQDSTYVTTSSYLDTRAESKQTGTASKLVSRIANSSSLSTIPPTAITALLKHVYETRILLASVSAIPRPA
jgi:hypothetical protein